MSRPASSQPTSQQYPLLMASLGIEAIHQYAADGTLPEPTEGKEFTDTGVALVAAEPVEGVEVDLGRRGQGPLLGLGPA